MVIMVRVNDAKDDNFDSKRKLLKFQIHTKCQSSLFSKAYGETHYHGFYNLSMILLAGNILRLIIENYRKYGIMAFWISSNRQASALSMTTAFPIIMLFLFVLLTSFVATYLTELIHFAVALILCCSLFIFSTMPFLLRSLKIDPGTSAFILIITLIVLMKMLSLIDIVTTDPKMAKIHHQSLSPFSLLRFVFLPTLCFQYSYPETGNARPIFLLKRMIELISSILLFDFLLKQYAIPATKNTIFELGDLKLVYLVERLLKLSIPCLLIWMTGFYAIFHSLFNITAELLHFGDRCFYQDWWNAQDLGEYWRLWNRPVYLWTKRHLLSNLQAKGYTKASCMLIIFLISAFLHEYIIAFPTGIYHGWALIAMLLQLPLIFISRLIKKKFSNRSIGNYLFWISFSILGHPMAVLLYYWSWRTINK